MSRSNFQRRGFTLVELLVVIGIIALLVGILLPTLGRVRGSAQSLKCAANLRSIGQGIADYLSRHDGVYPPAAFYKGLAFDNVSGQLPTTPSDGYVHWSSFLYGNRDRAGDESIYRQLDGWDAFRCPALDNGGLPPANTFAGNNDGYPNESSGAIDHQAPRLAYTINEALAPRGVFVPFFSDRGNVRVYRFVKGNKIRSPASTILATEIWGAQDAVLTDSLTGGFDRVSASRRPVHGFTAGIAGPEQLYKVPYSAGFIRSTSDDVDRDPLTNPGATPTTLLDWVGRNHGPRRKDSRGFDARKSNFLYADGHVQTKHVLETLTPFEWGERFYSLERR